MSADLLEFQMKALGLKPEKEFMFHPTRKWRSDWAFPEQMLLVEFEGGVWIQGRHNRASGFLKDLDKYNAATLLGYRVLRFAADHVKSGVAVALIEEVLQ